MTRMTIRFKQLAAGFALAGFLLFGALAGIGYTQARATTTTGTVTIRSIISGALTFASGTSIDIDEAGVRLSGDGDGALTFLGLGNGADEAFTMNLDDTANTIVFSSSTGANAVNLTGFALTVDSCTGCGAAGAPSDATYITQTANGSLSAEQALAALSSGIMRVATTTGVITSLTDSAGIFANISDETGGSGVLVGSASPNLTGIATMSATDAQWFMGGTTDPGWGVPALHFQVANGHVVSSATGSMIVGNNVYEAAADTPRYIATNTANRIVINSGGTAFQVAASGTAGNAITFTTVIQTLSTGTAVTFPSLPAGAAGDTDACLNSSTNELTDAGANTCTVSSLRFKDWKGNLDPVESLAKVMQLTPGAYTYKAGQFTDQCVRTKTVNGVEVADASARAACQVAKATVMREHIGFNAENMSDVEPRLTWYDSDGLPLTINFEETTALLASSIQALKLENDALRARVDALEKQ